LGDDIASLYHNHRYNITIMFGCSYMWLIQILFGFVH